MKKMKSLVVLFSMLFGMLFSVNVNSQILTFNASNLGVLHTNFLPKQDLGKHTLSIDSVNENDTLFYLKFRRNSQLFIYYGIIDTIDGSDIKFEMHCETEKDIRGLAFIKLNGVDITGPWAFDDPLFHTIKYLTFKTNDTIKFDILTILDVPFKFSFYFTDSVSLGVEDNYFVDKPEFKVYPNPCENTLNIEAEGLKRLFDMSGRLLIETYENTINMSDFAPGFYVVMLESGVRVKVMKE